MADYHTDRSSTILSQLLSYVELPAPLRRWRRNSGPCRVCRLMDGSEPLGARKKRPAETPDATLCIYLSQSATQLQLKRQSVVLDLPLDRTAGNAQLLGRKSPVALVFPQSFEKNRLLHIGKSHAVGDRHRLRLLR